MNETKSQAMAQYPVRAREPLPSNESAPVPFRVSRAGRLVDVAGLPPNVAVVQARLGRVRYSREEMRSTFAEFLASEPQDVKAGTYCVFTVMNVGAKPVEVAGIVIVEGEHGEVVEGLPLREADDASVPAPSPRDASSARNARNAANDAMVDAIIDNATMPDGTPVTKAKPSKSKSSKTSKPATGRRPSPTPATAPMPRAGAMKSQKIMSRHARRQRYEAEASIAKPIAGGGLRVILLHVGHVAMLDLALTAYVPLDEAAREEISAAICEAHEDVTTDGVGVVAVHLSEADCQRLSDAIDARAEYTLEDTETLCAAVKRAFDGPKVADATSVAASEAGQSETAPEAALKPSFAPASDAEPVASTPTTAEAEAPSAPVEKTEVGNVTPIHGKVQDDGRPQSRLSAPAKSVNEA